MAFKSRAIRDSIIALIEGRTGSIRVLEAGLLLHSELDGLSPTALQSKLVQNPHWFDVSLDKMANHPATSSSSRGNRRIITLPVVIHFWTATPTIVQLDERADLLTDIISLADDIVEALHFASNLETDENGIATNIVSGMLIGPALEGAPEFDIVLQDWNAQRIEWEIRAAAIVVVEQAVA